MNDRVAMRDIHIELVECVATEVLEVLLHLHFHVRSCEVAMQSIAIDAELVGNGR